MVIVCAAIIHKGDKILIAQRLEGSHLEFMWEFPGGKVIEGEYPKQCVVREIREELDIDIEANDIYDVVFHKYEDKNVLLLVYDCTYISGEPKAVDCNAFEWVTLNELDSYNFTSADKEVVNKLTKHM